MSSSVGGSFGGSGSAGTIRYVITIDDSQVNSKLSNIERSLQGLNSSLQGTTGSIQGLNSATQSTGTGLMNLNNSVQTLGSTTQKTTTDLDAINSNWQSMNQGAQNASNSVDALGNSFKSTQGGITGADGKLKNWNSSVESSETANKSFGSTLKENALSLTLTASGIVGLVSNFTQLEKAQVMANRATVGNEKAQRTLSNAQAKVNQLIAEGKKGTPEYTKAVRDLNIAQDSAKIAADRMRIAIQTFNERTASFLPQMAQDLLFVGGGITNMVSGLKDLKTLNIKGTFQGIGAAISGIGAPLAVAIAGVYALLFALKAASNLTDIAKEKFGKAYVEMSTGYAGLLRIKQAFHLTTKEEDAALAQLDKQMSSNAITTDDYTKAVTDAAVNPLPKSVENLITKLVNLKPPMADAISGTDDYTTANDDLITSNEDLTTSTLDQTKAESEANDERVATMKSIKGAGDLFEYYRVTGNQAATTTDNLGNVTDAFGNKLGNTYQNMKTFGLGVENDIIAKMEDAGVKARQFRNDFDKAWADFGQQSFDAISKAFGDESQIDKMLKKFKKFTSKKIDMFIDLKVKDQDVKKLASTVISGLDDYMTTDKKADEVGKDLIKMINSQFKKGKTPQGAKDIIAYINYAISQPNTKELLDKLGQDIKNGDPIPVPVILTPGPAPLWDFLKDDNKKGKKGKKGKKHNVALGIPNGDFGIWNLPPTEPMCFNEETMRYESCHKGDSQPGKNPIGGTDFRQLQISQTVPGSNKTPQFDTFARQLVQIIKDMSVFAQTIVQVTKDMNLWARAITQTTSDNNQFARTIAQLIKNNNTYAKTIVTTYKDISVLASATVETTKDNNQFAKTIVQITKNNNTYAKTIVQITKDINVLAKATVQETKDNNQLARTINQVGKNFNSATSDAKQFAKALIAVAAAAKKARAAGSGSRLQAAAEGFHGIVTQPTLFLAGEAGPEAVNVSPLSKGSKGGQSITINLVNNMVGNDWINDRTLKKTIRMEIGKNMDRFA